MNDIDESNIQIDNVVEDTQKYILKKDKIWVFLLIVAAIGVVVANIELHLDIKATMSLAAVVIASGFVGCSDIYSKLKKQFTKQFGDLIGFTYTPSADLSSVSGKLFKIGHDQRIFDVLSGKESGRDSRIFSYRFIEGYGKNSQTYNFTVFETTFANSMPDIVLTSSVGLFSSGFSLFDSSEHIQLEGDFNKYFTLKVPKGYEQEAYQIFTPDVMAALIDRAKKLNFEFNGNKLYIYTSYIVTVRTELLAMFDLAKYLDGLFAQSSRAV